MITLREVDDVTDSLDKQIRSDIDRHDCKYSHLSRLRRFGKFDENLAFIEFAEFKGCEIHWFPQKPMELGRRRLRENCGRKRWNDHAQQNGKRFQATSRGQESEFRGCLN